MKRYPRSFLQLVTYGHILVFIPFLFVTIYSFITLKSLDDQYHAAIENVSATSSLTGEIAEDLISMERSLRRYEVLKDAASLNDYDRVRTEWRNHVESFSHLSAMPEYVMSELKGQIQLENMAYTVIGETQNTRHLRSAIEKIKVGSQKVRDGIQDILNHEQEKFSLEALVLRQRLLLAMGVAVVVSLCSIWLSRWILSSLIGRFERAVLKLGKGELKTPIVLEGPADLRWLGRWLEWLRRRLRTLEESRAQVLRHVSHELKTPLAAMREGANLLAEEVPGSLTVEQARIVQILQSNSKRLQDLIEGLLRLQQAEHAAERIGFESLRFDQLIEQVLETFRLLAAERQISFQPELSEVTIFAGQEGLLTIVNNLLSNAVKYSPLGGKIYIALKILGDQACLDVNDEGPGIAEQDKGKIFEPFYRSSTSCQIAGVGLGLAIAREFVLAHRGEFVLLDSTQSGAHFRVLLPLNANFLRTQPPS